jgi:hypothetical protein
MLSCNKCGYGFNFKKATELLDEFKKIKEPSEFVKEALQDNNKIIGEFTLPQLTKKLSSIKNLDSDRINRIKNLYKFTKENLESRGLLICSYCNFVKFIDSGQILLEDTFVTSNKDDPSFNTELRIQDKTLPRTREYECKNKKCPSHKKPKLREAIIYRRGKSMSIYYMCCACKHYWSISS